MIRFANEQKPNKYPFKKNKSEILQELLDIIYKNTKDFEYYEGLVLDDSDLSEMIDIVYKTLFNENKNSIQITISKSSNNNINLTIDQVN